MIAVKEAQSLILSRITTVTSTELIAVSNALGRVLAGDLRAPFDVPPADNSAVDGYAIPGPDVPSEGRATLTVVADLPAGSVFAGIVGRGQSVRIMTGAPMPEGTDTVVPQELAQCDGDTVRVPPIARRANVRFAGEDVKAGAVIVTAGAVLRPQELGIAASLGRSQIAVRRKPRVAVFSTGDEVAEPGQPRRPGQIYDSNRFSLLGLVETAGGEPLDLGIVPDAREELRARLADASQAAEIVLTSGGVSVGAYDLVKEVLGEIGGIDFWQVAMQPGRPLAVGRIGAAHFFGLPGNPVASMLTFSLFVRPALWKLAGRREWLPRQFTAVAMEPIEKKTGRREFKRGILTFGPGGWEVRTTGPQGSGILTSMVLANCFIILEEERGDVKPGETVQVEPFSLF
jgi:molybdopterin molybdotransferase